MYMNNTIDAIIEISKDSNLKYEFDKEQNLLRLDRLLSSAMCYPSNYAYIPNTLAEDGDALDILVICPYTIAPNTILKTKIIGALIMTDEKGLDEKIISVPCDTVDNHSIDINELYDLKEHVLEKIRHFFTYYKGTDKNKWSKVDKFINKNEAIKLIKKYTIEKLGKESIDKVISSEEKLPDIK